MNTLRSNLSPNEIKMFETIDECLHMLDLDVNINETSFLKIVAQNCFEKNKTGPAVDALRRACVAMSQCNPYRHTPEYEKLISFENEKLIPETRPTLPDAVSIPDFHFKTDEDVKVFLRFICTNHFRWHLDDNPMECFGDEAIGKKLAIASERLWKYCNPWEFIDKPENRDMRLLYMRLTEEEAAAEDSEVASLDKEDWDEIEHNIMAYGEED